VHFAVGCSNATLHKVSRANRLMLRPAHLSLAAGWCLGDRDYQTVVLRLRLAVADKEQPATKQLIWHPAARLCSPQDVLKRFCLCYEYLNACRHGFVTAQRLLSWFITVGGWERVATKEELAATSATSGFRYSLQYTWYNGVEYPATGNAVWLHHTVRVFTDGLDPAPLPQTDQLCTNKPRHIHAQTFN
jgi:hypothetical protein